MTSTVWRRAFRAVGGTSLSSASSLSLIQSHFQILLRREKSLRHCCRHLSLYTSKASHSAIRITLLTGMSFFAAHTLNSKINDYLWDRKLLVKMEVLSFYGLETWWTQHRCQVDLSVHLFIHTYISCTTYSRDVTQPTLHVSGLGEESVVPRGNPWNIVVTTAI